MANNRHDDADVVVQTIRAATSDAKRAILYQLGSQIQALTERLATLKKQELECHRDIGGLLEEGVPIAQNYVTYRGHTLGLKGWAEEMKINRQKAYRCLSIKQQWPTILELLQKDPGELEDALKTLRSGESSRESKPVEFAPEELLALARKHGVDGNSATDISALLNEGMKLIHVRKQISVKQPGNRVRSA